MRTVKEFVKQLFMEQKTPQHIRAVASCSRWSNQMGEVDRWISYGEKKTNPKKRKFRKIKKRIQ